jgi:hypothetical protein
MRTVLFWVIMQQVLVIPDPPPTKSHTLLRNNPEEYSSHIHTHFLSLLVKFNNYHRIVLCDKIFLNLYLICCESLHV